MLKEILSILRSKPVGDLISAAAKPRNKPNWRQDLTKLSAKFGKDQEHETYALIDHVIGQLSAKKWEQGQIDNVLFVAHELLVNAFKHGYARNTRGRVHVRVTYSEKFCWIFVASPGLGFDLMTELQRQGYLNADPDGKHALALISASGVQLTQPKGKRTISATIKRNALSVKQTRITVRISPASDEMGGIAH